MSTRHHFFNRFAPLKFWAVLGLLVLAMLLPTAAQAQCTFTVTALSVTPAASVGATVTATAALRYQGCQARPLSIRDNAPANLAFASCSVVGAAWNCASVASAAGVTTSSFTPVNNGLLTETVRFAYTASAIGCPSLSITPVINGVAGAARASTCSGAPSVTTGSATSTSSTSATLNGAVASNGVAVTAIAFKYGTASGVYGTTVAATPATLAANAGPVAVSRTVSGLTCGTTYFYRATATNASGTTDGPEQSFRACFGLTKVASNSNVPVGTNFRFTLTVANATGSTVNGVVVTDDLGPSGLRFVSCTTADGSCSALGTVVTWSPGNVATGSSPTATLTVQAASSGSKTNTATVNTTGTPVAISVVNAYAPLADWRMDEASWNGTAGEVRDSTGNGYNGRAAIAAGSTAVASTLSTAPVAYSSGGRSTCGYGDFDRASGPTRTNTYVELTGIPTLPPPGISGFTFAAWIRTTNASQSGQRILVRDDADNGWGFSLGDPGNGRIRLFNRNMSATGTVTGTGSIGCGVNSGTFCLDTSAVITNNNWFFVAVSVDTAAKSVAHYVFNTGGTLLSTTSATYSGTWKDGTGLASLGGETASSSEGRTPSFHVKGNIDEVQIYEGVLSQADVALLLTRSRTCAGSGPDHVELVHNGAALTCSAKEIKVLGCTSAASCNGAVADQYVGSVSFTPSAFPGAQWCSDALCTAPLSGAITVPSGTTIYLREPTARPDTLGGTATGTLTSAVQCLNTSTASFGTGTAACDVGFAGAGFLVNVPNHRSCTPQTVTLQAVRADATGTACVPAFSGVNRNVNLYSGYANPSTGTRSASLSYVTSSGGASSSVASLSVSPGSPTSLTNLYFDATGTARLTGFSYPDVGQVTLFPTYTGGAATNDSGLSIAAVSGNVFIAAPASLALSGIPAAPLTAGSPFNTTVTALNACSTPAVTPNFGRETTPATVALASSNPLPALGNATPINQTVSGFNAGAASTNLTWNEVGTIDLTASVTDYLGSGVSATGSQSAVGRFRPAYFDTTRVEGCNSFTYSGQPFAVTVTAKAAGGVNTTANYAGATWARLVTVSDANGGTGTWSANTIAATSFSGGVGVAPAASYTFLAKATAPAAIRLRSREPVGADGVDSSTGSEAVASIRSGRARLLNAYGSELLALPMTTRIEHFGTLGATGWRAGADTCTSLSSANFAYSFPANPNNRLAACETFGSLGGANPEWVLSLARPCVGTPCAGNNGWANVVLNLGSSPLGSVSGETFGRCTASGASGGAELPANLPWLTFDWLGTGPTNPRALATFGIHRSPLIYSRENY